MDEVLDLAAIAAANATRIAKYQKTREEFSVGGSPWSYAPIPPTRDISTLAGLEDESVEKDQFTGTVTSILPDKGGVDKNGNRWESVIVSVKVGRTVLTTVGPMYGPVKGQEVTFTGVAVAKGAEFLHIRGRRGQPKEAVIITANRALVKTFGFFS